ncbi:NADP-dependent oxidoreductase domain-containing protein [Podospora aff. communis PSN243]|uniref:NADP-dependent oxidoreductase domain-containing protein n=1 Tax=Podospora aff. communis PSN243 TaxID=3040156 RepID=A0AAV9GJ04_9PEZI|nr:NADP-dependent oxidoreductase domain-containing protein [Podospora aff. communis PSN243]
MPSPTIPLRQLGHNGPMIPQLGFGTMGLTYDAYGSVPSDEERFAVLDRAYEIGARFWDTSDLYGDGEQLIGRWFKRTGKRSDIFLATKFGYVKNSSMHTINSTGVYCKTACAESLQALGIDSIDLYYMHQADPNTPIEDTMRALAELKTAGKIKHIGLSNVSSSTLRRASRIAPVAAVQVDYSPFVLDIETPLGTNLLATARSLGTAIVAAVPLGRGLLTSTFALGETIGDANDKRPLVMPRFQEENRLQNVQAVGQFKAFADRMGCTPAQLALAWLMKQGGDIFPIPGTKRIKYLEENCKAVEVSLSDEDEAEIRKFLEGVEIAGDKVPKGFEDWYFVTTREE